MLRSPVYTKLSALHVAIQNHWVLELHIAWTGTWPIMEKARLGRILVLYWIARPQILVPWAVAAARLRQEVVLASAVEVA